jgi:hypothetical protein
MPVRWLRASRLLTCPAPSSASTPAPVSAPRRFARAS